jgi:acyl-coenzyme A thioesterase PaaI-like protein
VTQAGVHSLLLDACMNFAINAALSGRDRTKATLELKTETMRPALRGVTYALRGEVVRMARQVAYGEASVRDDEGALVSRATGTFLLHRAESASPD